MTNFFTADTHFGHARILELANRPFSSVDEMNRLIIENFNARAGAGDTIFLLGDACMGKLDDSLELIRQIEAQVILIPGNHDRLSRAYLHAATPNRQEKLERQAWRYGQYFHDIWLEPEGGRSVFLAPFEVESPSYVGPLMMSHYPYHGDHTTEERFSHLRPNDVGAPLIHGHVHTLWWENGRQLNVGVDVNDFQLVSEAEVRDWVWSLG